MTLNESHHTDYRLPATETSQSVYDKWGEVGFGCLMSEYMHAVDDATGHNGRNRQHESSAIRAPNPAVPRFDSDGSAVCPFGPKGSIMVFF